MEKKRVRFGHAAGMCALCGTVLLHGWHQCEPSDQFCRPGDHVENSDAPGPFPSSRQTQTIATSTATGTATLQLADIDWRKYIVDK